MPTPTPPRGNGIVRLPEPRRRPETSVPRRLPAVEFVWPQRPARVPEPEPRPADDLSAAELDALAAGLAPAEVAPSPAGLHDPTPVDPSAQPGTGPSRSRRRLGTAAVAVAGGVMSLVAATVPTDALSAGYGAAAFTADGAEDTGSDGSDGTEGGLPPVADAGAIASSVTEAHRQVADQVAATQTALENARLKALADKAVAEKVAADQEAAEKAAAEQRAAEEKAAEEAVTSARDCGVSTSQLGAVKSHVRTAAELLGCRFGEPTMLGVAGRGGVSDHPGGKAVDFMIGRAQGDALADCALRNKEALGITYVIWRQRINFGNGWEGMEDRGGVTANHFDHVHVSFGNGAEGTSLKGCG